MIKKILGVILISFLTICLILTPSPAMSVSSTLDWVIGMVEQEAINFKVENPSLMVSDEKLNTAPYLVNCADQYKMFGISSHCDDVAYFNMVLFQKYGYTFVEHELNADDQIHIVHGKFTGGVAHGWNVVRLAGNNLCAVNAQYVWWQHDSHPAWFKGTILTQTSFSSLWNLTGKSGRR